MSNEVLNTESRTDLGKEKIKKLRRQGLVPAIYYHHGETPVNLTIKALEFARVYRTGNKIIDIVIDKKKKTVLIRDIQFHPVTEDFLHVDFQGVHLSEEIHVTVPLKYIGTPIGVREGGLLEPMMHEVEIKCKVSNVPHELEINVSDLERGHGIYIKDLGFSGIEFLVPQDAMIVMVSTASGMSKSEEGEEGEGAEETEGSEEGSED